MRSFTTVAAALLFVGAQAAPAVESRQIVYGCYFNGDGIANQYVTVGSDIDITGKSGKVWTLDCGTTSEQIVKGVFAKCTVNGKQPFGITGFDAANINCPIA
ncbi:uncharacterized protein CTRU02_200247 [Colletotrichum truncatum]|uniref:Uncharacterized protein n=1 Tax=Colletotrichum truncatum TaxID=5467 RepID=A0ACC3ZE40_COLTU|nr:uncharacterized protein CTRU02_05126 [Colletotrichum truncatum]XP_036589248.1 uncharacterized protein CTRU02_00002 [Colletotrichum truncatum]KAF6794925.1 hypothetical protein CTRU02_05126 [Colletotrichum truncatum]KAF6801253.1 hypothetical protein CTRU02_00002 [Colletotrichum truncatum]